MSQRKKDFIHRISLHQGLIRSLCVAYFRAEEDREDAFQEVLLQLWKSYPTFRGRSSFVTWVYSVALRTLIRLAERSRRFVTCEYLPEYDPASRADTESEEVIYVALSYLKPHDKALVLLYLEGYQYQEIATLLDLSATNVSTRLARIKQKMKTIITEQLL